MSVPPARRRQAVRINVAADILEMLPTLVRTARLARGRTLYDAAAEIGIHMSLLFRIEHAPGPNFHGTTLVKVLRWLGDTDRYPDDEL